MELFLPDHQATLCLGEAIAKCICNGKHTGCVIALHGQLGAGKTTLVKGIGGALGVTEAISSPTFTMLNEYHSGRMPLYHLDLYRVGESSDVISLEMLAFEIDELICRKPNEVYGVTVVEWAEFFVGGSHNNYLDQYDHINLSISREAKSSVKKEVPTFNREPNSKDRAGAQARVDTTNTSGGRAGEDGSAHAHARGGEDADSDWHSEDELGRLVLLSGTGPKSQQLISELWQEVTDMLIYS